MGVHEIKGPTSEEAPGWSRKPIQEVKLGEYVLIMGKFFRVKGTANYNTAFIGLTTELYLEGREPYTLPQNTPVSVCDHVPEPSPLEYGIDFNGYPEYDEKFINGPYASREILVAAWGAPERWTPPLVIVARPTGSTERWEPEVFAATEVCGHNDTHLASHGAVECDECGLVFE